MGDGEAKPAPGRSRSSGEACRVALCWSPTMGMSSQDKKGNATKERFFQSFMLCAREFLNPGWQGQGKMQPRLLPEELLPKAST